MKYIIELLSKIKAYGHVRIFNGILLTVSVVLTILSVLALFTLHYTLFTKYRFDLSAAGTNEYLDSYAQHKSLFTATVATIAAYMGLLRLKTASEANADKVRQDRFLEWKAALEVRSKEIEDTDKRMIREFTNLRYKLFLELHAISFKLENREQLQRIFDTHFKERVAFFERNNERALQLGEIYQNETYSYTFTNFMFLFSSCLDKIYNEYDSDLHKMYLAAMDPHRTISPEMYRSAINNRLTKN